MSIQMISALIVIILLLPFGNSSNCPEFWLDASLKGLGCLSFNTSLALTNIEAEDMCKRIHYAGHLVEIHSENQQEYMVKIAQALEDLTGSVFNWWIGLTDEDTEGQWYWSYSQTEAEYTGWCSDLEPNDNSTVSVRNWIYNNFKLQYADLQQNCIYLVAIYKNSNLLYFNLIYHI